MYRQREVLRSGVVMDFASSYELDLPKQGRLTDLTLYIRSTENASAFLTSIPKWRLIDYISKIEVIGDGSEVIKSFDGQQALACAFYDDFREPVSMWRNYSNTPQRQWIPIHFGRWFHDLVYGLDLSRFNQVQLKITNDATSTQFTTGITLDVIADWVREPVSAFAGYFREEEWKTWAPAAAEVAYNVLPTLLPIRRILLRARPGRVTATSKNASSMHRLMNPIDFTVRTGQLRRYLGSLETLGHMSVMEWPALAETRGMIYRNSNLGFEAGVGYITNSQKVTATYTDAPATYPAAIGTPDIQDSALEVQQFVGDAPLEWSARGHGYMHNVPLLYDTTPDLSQLLDPRAENEVKVDVTCQSGTTVAGTDRAAQNAIILSRLVR